MLTGNLALSALTLYFGLVMSMVSTSEEFSSPSYLLSYVDFSAPALDLGTLEYSTPIVPSLPPPSTLFSVGMSSLESEYWLLFDLFYL